MCLDNNFSSFRPITRAVRQGCVLLPDLFNLFSDYILRDTDELKRASIGGQNLSNLRHADDTVLLLD